MESITTLATALTLGIQVAHFFSRDDIEAARLLAAVLLIHFTIDWILSPNSTNRAYY